MRHCNIAMKITIDKSSVIKIVFFNGGETKYCSKSGENFFITLKDKYGRHKHMIMLAIYWEPKSAFQNTFCIYSTRNKHNNSTTVKPLRRLSFQYSWVQVTVPEALPALRPCKMPVFYRSLSGTLSRAFTRQVPARLIEPKILFTVFLYYQRSPTSNNACV